MKLLHRNWRVGRQELDLVLVDRNTLVVVEVKTRQSEWAAELGSGMRSGNGSSFESEEVVREAQLERIRKATESYLARFAVRLKRLGVVQYRIEVVVVRLGGGEVRIKSSKICASTAW
jgi:Holliday junction resolvase-like predicted endonuclease